MNMNFLTDTKVQVEFEPFMPAFLDGGFEHRVRACSENNIKTFLGEG